jgi:SAM-dependent methyltransferase
MLRKAVYYPPIEKQFKNYKKYIQGLVLNAGSGIRSLGTGDKVNRVINIDISFKSGVDITGDLHEIPLKKNSVDTVINIAVLEHVRHPWLVIQEFYRVLKPGGYLVCDVPFLQTKHPDPTDFYRYTREGLEEIIRYGGFKIISSNDSLGYFHTWGRITAELLESKKIFYPLELLLYPFVRILTKYFFCQIETCSHASTVIATKN